jgi:GDPmannose 4,6-dehydratase
MKRKKKVALITGITGQDGSYLAEFLLKKNYIVHGIKRRTSMINTDRIDHLYTDLHEQKKVFFKLHHGDLTDTSSIIRILKETKPDEIYNLGAQSHVAVSFETPEYTANTDALGTLRILEAIRILDIKCKFYQASTSELYGNVGDKIKNENTPFHPSSPYAIAKLYSHWITKNYRESYGIFACSGILFNHESPVRGETFVTRKISIGLVKIYLGTQKKLYLGNLNAKRDWGHASDYVVAMWLMLQQKKPKDYVIASGRQYSVRDFVNAVARQLKMQIQWKGKGIREKGYDAKGRCIIEVDKKYYRPTDVHDLLGNPSKAKRELKWKPKMSFKMLVQDMVASDLKKEKEKLD